MVKQAVDAVSANARLVAGDIKTLLSENRKRRAGGERKTPSSHIFSVSLQPTESATTPPVIVTPARAAS